MDSSDVTAAQAEKMRDALGPYIRYLHLIKRRMEAQGFPLTDELFQKTNRAYDAAHALTMALHYLSCQSGVGRPAKVPNGEERKHGRKDRGEP